MPRTEDLTTTLLDAWRTSGQVTDFLVVARALNERLPAAVTNGLWQWSTFVRERTRPARRPAARR